MTKAQERLCCEIKLELIRSILKIENENIIKILREVMEEVGEEKKQ